MSKSDKVEIVSDPTTMPHLKKSRTLLEVPVSPSLSSQQDLYLNMANEPFLYSSSQYDESIELRHRAMSHCTESRTLPLLTIIGRKYPIICNSGHTGRRGHVD